MRQREKKLDSPGIDSVEREIFFTQIAYDLNQLAEIYFNKGEYRTATRLFVEADAFTRRFHDSTYARYRQQLAEYEAKLPEYAKEPNKEKRDILYNTGRIVVSMLLSQVITEADFFNDEKNKKIYLERLVVILKENKIIPNAALFLLPFSALLSPSDNQYLVEKHNIVFLTAGDLISPLTVTGSGSMVAFGNPAEADLEGALEEVKAIQSVYPGAKVYTDVAATKSQLFKIKSARILHLATHGHILSPLESSNIQLAHLPDLADPDLSYGEIYSLPVESMEMVVLSACQTALGAVSGTEIGVFIEAFRTKAKTVVASLWSVDDMATKMLMTAFYKGLHGGKSRAKSMREAQLTLLKDKRTKNPLFWSAFVMYGEGGRL